MLTAGENISNHFQEPESWDWVYDKLTLHKSGIYILL